MIASSIAAADKGRIQLLHSRPQLLHVDRLRIIARDLRPIDIVVAQLLAEQLDYRIFKIGFGEVHKSQTYISVSF